MVVANLNVFNNNNDEKKFICNPFLNKIYLFQNFRKNSMQPTRDLLYYL